MEKQQQPIINQRDQSEKFEEEELSNAESFSSNDAGNSQEF
jgi:hypothetical protein